ncbi:hypothetical protein AM305_08731, partial [Actinobacillus minor NM305]
NFVQLLHNTVQKGVKFCTNTTLYYIFPYTCDPYHSLKSKVKLYSKNLIEMERLL